MQREIGINSEDFFYVDVFSNSNSKDDKNTTVRFVNTLARELDLNPQDGWMIGLTSIICNNKFFVKSVKEDGNLFYSQEQVEKDTQLSQVYIACDQVQQTFDGRGLISCHSRTPYTPESNRVHVYEPKNILFFPLKTHLINEIGITLLSPNLEQLFLRPGQVTTLTLKFQKANMRETLTPIFISSKGMWAQEGNTASNFTCEIPRMFTNAGNFKWQIGLNSCTYVSDFRLFPKRWTTESYFYIGSRNIITNEYDTANGGDSMKVWGGSGSEAYMTNRAMIPQEDIDKWTTEKDVRAYLYDFIKTEVKTWIGYRNTFVVFSNLYNEQEEEADPNYKYTGPISMYITAACIFSCPSWVMEILGFRNYPTVGNGRTAIFTVDRPKRIFARTTMDVYSLAPHSISIYADFIEQKLMANIQTSVLKTIPVKHKFGKTRPSTTYESTTIEYYNLATRDLSKMSFRLMDSSGHEVEFANPEQNITLSLILKTTM